MQRRYFHARRSDSILLYSFALVLAISLAFNAFLLYKQSHHRTIYEFEAGSSTHPADNISKQLPLPHRKQASQPKESRNGSPTHQRSD
ncbi:MAG: hypothetical protein JWP57_1643 [Spirosoma sp.]|nr:hypothetical protein [Spirosoma sp.]